MVVLNYHQVVQCIMNCIILSEFSLNRQDAHGTAIINKEVDLSICLLS